MRRAEPRRGFSLLEMVLALAIGMLLLLALYAAFNTYIEQARIGRDIVAEAALSRSIMNRIQADIAGQIGPIDPRMPDSSSTSDSTTTPAPVTPVGDQVIYNNGVNGKRPNVLVISNMRVRKNVPSDTSNLQLTAYWVVMNGSEPAGLAKAEIRQATSADIDTLNLDPNTLDQSKYTIIAPEVKSIEFRYYDGSGGGAPSSWPDTYDGSVSPVDGLPPLGPPRAIYVKITLKKLDRGTNDPNADGPIYTQVIAVPTSNAWTPSTGQ